MNFTIAGKFKPYVRMTQRGKWVDKQAQEYLASKSALAWEYRQQMPDGVLMFDRAPLKANIDITMTGGLHRSDIDNQAKALIDAAQCIVFSNDCWIDMIEVSRRLGNEDVVEIEISQIKEANNGR